jgi:hypothetical protein
MIRFLLFTSILITFVAFCPEEGMAACEIEDVLEMVDEDLSKREISSECQNQISDAPNCSVRKVIKLASDGYDTEEIITKCSGGERNPPGLGDPGPGPMPQSSNICQTSFMWCALGQAAPPGTPCYCNTWQGPMQGIITPR